MRTQRSTLPDLIDGPAHERRPARLRHFAASAADWAVRHPVLASFLVALVVRAMVAVVIAVARTAYLVPDEAQYVELARHVARGDGAESWVAGYGQGLYRDTYAFSGLLAALFRVFGAHRSEGQAIAVFFGAVTAAATARLALEATTRRWALLAGLFVALLPSGIFWSSLVLRESMVWATLAVAAAAIAVAASAGGLRLLVCGLIIFTCLLALGYLRDQTLLAAVGALLVTGLLLPGAHRWKRTFGTLVIVALVPLFSGAGFAGLGLLQKAAPELAVTRGKMSLGAKSVITPTTMVAPPTTIGVATTTTIVTGSERLVQGDDGAVVVVEESVGSNLRYLPHGVFAVTLRPYPWDSTESAESDLAKVENVVWLALYGLAFVGLIARRRRLDVLAFPLVCVVLIVGAGALTQGNLGTAFRHRSQLTWALAVLAVLGAEAIVDRRRRPAAA